MDRVLKDIVNKTIEREHYRAEESLGAILQRNQDVAVRYNKNTEEFDCILNEIKEVLPDKHKKLGEKLDLLSSEIAYDLDYLMFKEGIILGVTELNYLKELGATLAGI